MRKEILNRMANEPLDPRQARADRERAASWHAACKPADPSCPACGKGNQTCSFCASTRESIIADKAMLNMATCRDCRRTFWLNPEHAALEWAGLSCPSCNSFWKLFRNFDS